MLFRSNHDRDAHVHVVVQNDRDRRRLVRSLRTFFQDVREQWSVSTTCSREEVEDVQMLVVVREVATLDHIPLNMNVFIMQPEQLSGRV